MAVAETGGGATARNTWKILAAVFIVLTIGVGGRLAYVATLSRGTTGTVTYPIGIEIAISGSYATDGPLRRDGAFLAVDQMNDQLAAAGWGGRFTRIPEDARG